MYGDDISMYILVNHLAKLMPESLDQENHENWITFVVGVLGVLTLAPDVNNMKEPSLKNAREKLTLAMEHGGWEQEKIKKMVYGLV